MENIFHDLFLLYQETPHAGGVVTSSRRSAGMNGTAYGIVCDTAGYASEACDTKGNPAL